MLVHYKEFSSNRKFGVEFEVEKDNITQGQIRDIIISRTPRYVETTGWGQTNNNDFWHVKTDSTCGPELKGKNRGGWEVASFVAKGDSDLIEIASIADGLRQNNVVVNNNCGFHIHVDIADFSPSSAGILLAYWIKMESILIHLLPDHRLESNYCRLLSRSKAYEKNCIYGPEDFWFLIKPNNYAHNNNIQKRVSLNLINFAAYKDGLSHRGTAELRLPECNLNSTDVINWVRFFLLFIATLPKHMPDNLKPYENLDEFLEILKFVDKDNFYILGKKLLTLKSWILQRIITYGKETSIIKDALGRIQQMIY